MSSSSAVVARAAGLAKRFAAPSVVEAVKNASLEVRRGELIALVGPSGAGKSTLLALLGGLLSPSGGRVEVEGTDLTALDDAERARFRNTNIGFVFQFHHLLPELTALENVALPGLIAAREGWRSRTPRALDARARELLAAVGLDRRAHHRPTQLSGGEAQRLALARALMNEPALVLADEPTGNLDQGTASALMDLVQSLNRRDGRTFVIATHNPELMSRAGRVVRMTGGEVTA
ncbi:MAG: ABC transporter ATP-binding protein [bacterium]